MNIEKGTCIRLSSLALPVLEKKKHIPLISVDEKLLSAYFFSGGHLCHFGKPFMLSNKHLCLLL